MPDGLKERFACWKLRMFVRLFRPDICLKHKCRKSERTGYEYDQGHVWPVSVFSCELCTEERQATVAAQGLHRQEVLRLKEAATEEILNALKYCARKK